MSDYTLADLTRITGAKRRTVQLWAEGGVIIAMSGTGHGGKGTHRRFSRDEVILACIAHAFARQQMPIGTLLRATEMLRGALVNPNQKSIIEKAIKNTAKIYMILKGSGAPRFVHSLADGSANEELGIAIIDEGQAKEDLAGLVGKRVTEKSDGFGSFATTIMLNPYLEGME